MVLPLWDDNADRRIVPYVNYALIALNILVFVLFQRLGDNTSFTYAFSTVPAEIVEGHDITTEPQTAEDPVTGQKVQLPPLEPMPLPLPNPLSAWVTLLTSMFMHGSIAHIAGNMLFLWIFGDNLEDFMGHVRYVLFYLVCGVLASLAHVATAYVLPGDPADRLIPSLGASGAISGVMGGYVLLFPFRRVTVILFRFLTQVPAWVAVGLWFAFQVGYALFRGASGGGVAYGAHIGGFLAGVALVKLFAIGKDPQVWPCPVVRRARR